jgi:hypothetical protein
MKGVENQMKLKFVRKSSNKPIMFLVAVLGMVVIGISQVEALPIDILNASFENPGLSDDEHSPTIADWNIGVSKGAGVFNPTSAHFTGGDVPDGVQTAYLNDGAIGQWLDSYLTVNTTYTLKVDIGHRSDTSFPGYMVELVVKEISGSTAIALDDSTLTPSPGEFATSIVSFTALPGDPNLNKRLGIRLTTDGVQTNFDNVRLDATPEPSTIFLMCLGILGLLGIIIRRRYHINLRLKNKHTGKNYANG